MTKTTTKTAVAKAIKAAPKNKALDGKLAKKVTGKKGTVARAVETAVKKNAIAKAMKQAKAPRKPVVPKTSGLGTYANMRDNRKPESEIESPVHAMWDLCDSMVDSRRKDVITAAVEAGINYYTARTQYQLWLTAYRNSK